VLDKSEARNSDEYTSIVRPGRTAGARHGCTGGLSPAREADPTGAAARLVHPYRATPPVAGLATARVPT
jgi:hypothetical protein